MKTMKWLLRREFWEHKGAMAWAPLVAAGAILALLTSTVIYALARGHGIGRVTVRGESAEISLKLSTLPPEKIQAAVEGAANLYLAVSAPLFLMLSAVAFFYCLSALHDERRDRSILFWKSLPVSDAQTVASKVITAAIVAPLITIAIAVFMSVLLTLIVSLAFAFHGLNVIGPLLSQPAFYLGPLLLVGLLPVYALWALPTIGWLLLVSAWAKSKVFLWAVGVPILAIVVVKWADYLVGVGFDVAWFAENVVARGLGGLIPGIWLPMAKANVHAMTDSTHHTMAVMGVFTQSWMTLASPKVWIGAAAGVGMIVGAARLRRWKDEG